MESITLEELKQQVEALGLEEKQKNKFLIDEWKRIKDYEASAEERRLKREAEEMRLEREAEEKRLEREAEEKRLEREAEEKRLAREVEERRLEAERLVEERKAERELELEKARLELEAKRIETSERQESRRSVRAQAIASRGSNTGLAVRNGYGNHGNANVMNPIDKRSHHANTSRAPISLANVIQGAKILGECINGVTRNHPDWSKSIQMRGGTAVYNSGVNRVQTVKGIGRGTARGNHPRGVLRRRAK